MAQTLQPGDDVGRLINLIPVGLKEAAIDSPTSRATIVHYGEQIELLERWLEDYMKATNRLVAESATLENILNNFTSNAIVPTTIAESMLDHDYDVLAMKKYSEGAKDFWMSMVSVVKRMSTLVVEPIRVFLYNDLKAFKDARRMVELYQKNFDTAHTKYSGLGKSKEPSSLREEAFQLHEARKQYLRAGMDFFAMAPQFRFALDKLLVKTFYDQWKEMRLSRDNNAATFQRTATDMERVKGWVTEMETSERAFKRELQAARRQLEDAAEASTRPSRELDDYSLSTVAQYGGHAHSASGAAFPRSPKRGAVSTSEKHGYLYLRTYSGRPTRAVWIKRWAFLRNGTFGWLLQGLRTGDVVESERIGVLLCNVRPAPGEERRFCFELKTNKHTIVLQAETQAELVEWISAFQTAKSKALEDPGATDALLAPGRQHSDPAFAISHPPVPEFGTLILSSTEPGTTADDGMMGVDRTSTLPVPENNRDPSSLDIPRRATATFDEPGHTSRLMSKLTSKGTSPSIAASSSSPNVGGIASLIAASHSSMPVGPSLPMMQTGQHEPEKARNTFTLALRDMPPSSLAPSTLANIPAPTNLSRSAVIVTGERGLSAALDKSGIPNSLLANIWGSSSGAFVNRLDRSNEKVVPDARFGAQPSPLLLPSASPPKSLTPRRTDRTATMSELDLTASSQLERSRSESPTKRTRVNTLGVESETPKSPRFAPVQDFPNYYPLQLKTQDAQFRLLFPTVKRDERLVMVFRATWNPNDQQDFPGRVYVTAHNIYFYSNHLGLVLTSTVSLASIDEATAAPGRECDFLFLHMKEAGVDNAATRITIKTFLEPLRLLQRRINFLIKNSVADEPLSLEDVVKALLKMESVAPDRSPSLESWEDVPPDTPVDTIGQGRRGRATTNMSEFRAPIRVEHTLQQSSTNPTQASKFKLPAQPVNYTPPGNLLLAAEREFDVSPKALFHVMFGDKSALWQLLQHERLATNLNQGPWMNLGEGRLRRDFEFLIPSSNFLGQARTAEVRDYQIVDVNSDHLCYVVTDKRTPWHLPFQNNHRLVSKIVITHVAKGKCKLAIFVRVEWLRQPPPWVVVGGGVMQSMIERQALHDLDLDAQDLADLVADQVRKLGAHSRTKKAVQIFGLVGHSTEITQLRIDDNKQAMMNIEMRRTPVSRSMTGLLMQEASSLGQSALGLVLETAIDFVKWMAKTFNANKFILLVLVVSVLYNTYHTSRDTHSWYKERSAVKFMNNLGVGSPSNVMSKAVYMSDIDDVMAQAGELPTRHDSSCYSVFYDEHKLDDIDAPIVTVHSGTATGGGSEQQKDQVQAARRIQKTRQQLGKYRHDLLVAMRVVNGVEKEVVRSEWEGWVTDEARRCRAVEGIADTNSSSSEVGEWYQDYCRSCQQEVAQLGLI